MKLSRPFQYLIIATIVVISLLAWFFHSLFLHSWTYQNEPLHSSIEAIGALIAVLMTALLFGRRREPSEALSFWLALGLLAMGLLDGFHSVAQPGQGFVFLHSSANLAGGLLFLAAWLPSGLLDKYGSLRRWLLWITVSASIAFGTIVLANRQMLPVMVQEGKFTTAAIALNLIAGVAFLSASVRLLLEANRRNDTGVFLFAFASILFGFAGLEFTYSHLWDGLWWWWHITRITAYFLLLGFLAAEYWRGISELQKTHQELKRAAGALGEIKVSLAEAQHIAHVGSWDLDLVNDSLWMSEELYRIFGIKPDASQMTLGKVLQSFHPGDRESAAASINETITNSNPLDIEYRVLRPDGLQRIVHTRGAVVSSDRGRPMRMVGTVQDVTERREMEETLKAHAEELERSNKELEQFAYVASHDLQEPLRMIASYTQLLARRYKGKLDQDADEFIGYAVDGADRMQRLIQDLLAYSRVQTRGQEFVPLNCEEVLDEVLVILQLAIQESGAVITHDPLPTLTGDRPQLTQLFFNLIGNAIKFRGDSAPQVHISAKERGNNWIFSVQDNGIGIDPQYFQRVFVIFQRLHTRDKFPGTGIGLAIAQRIVHRHGGKIWVESKPGEGSTFSFTIPESRR